MVCMRFQEIDRFIFFISSCRTVRQCQISHASSGRGGGANVGRPRQRPAHSPAAASDVAADAVRPHAGATQAASHRRVSSSQRKQLRRISTKTSQRKTF